MFSNSADGGTGRRNRLKICRPWRAGSNPALRTTLTAALKSVGESLHPETRIPEGGPPSFHVEHRCLMICQTN